MVFATDGSLQGSDIYRATVRNHAKLAYNSVAAWLEGTGPMPQGIETVNGLEENLRLQDRVAQTLKTARYTHGALLLDTIEARPVFVGEELKDLETDQENRAKDLIADFMIAANGVTARYLASKKFPSLQRVVRTPKRWDRIVELAAEHGSTLPRVPDSKALEQFLASAKTADPFAFPIFLLVSLSCWVQVNMPSCFRERTQPGTSVLRSRIILTRPPRTADIRI